MRWVHGERPDVAEAVPKGPADGKVHRLDLDGESEAVGGRHLREVGVHAAQPPADFPLSGERSGQRKTLCPEVVQRHFREGVRQPDLGSLGLLRANVACAADVLGSSVAVVLDGGPGKAGQTINERQARRLGRLWHAYADKSSEVCACERTAPRARSTAWAK